jgi:thymidylate kinase
LFLASRCETVQKVKDIQKENAVDFIILDRFFVSTLVYQSLETDLTVEQLSQIISFSLQGVSADFMYYLVNTNEQIIDNLKNKGEYQDGDEFKIKVLKTVYHLINKFYVRNENITYLYEPQSSFAYQVIEDLRLSGFSFKIHNL